jgi:hypothetical protein
MACENSRTFAAIHLANNMMRIALILALALPGAILAVFYGALCAAFSGDASPVPLATVSGSCGAFLGARPLGPYQV